MTSDLASRSDGPHDVRAAAIPVCRERRRASRLESHAIVADNGGWFTTDAFPIALLANPADAFRLFNLTASGATAAAAGVGGAADAIPLWQSLSSVLIWPFAALALAAAAFRKVTP